MIISRRARELSLSVALFAIPVVLLYGNIGRPATTNNFDRAILRATGRLQWSAVQMGALGGRLWSRYVAVWQLQRRNEQLRRHNFELRENNEILKAWATRGRGLERELGFRVTPMPRAYRAEVVGRGVSPFFQVIKIRLSDQRIQLRQGLSVAVPGGLVGRVLRASGPYADVLLIDDVQSRIDVVVQRTASRGELRGTGEQGRLRGRIEYLSPRDEVRPGDLLTTSGMGGRFPPDLWVGKITRVRRRIRGRYQSVDVRAVVSFIGLQSVRVVTTRWAHRNGGQP